MSNQVVADSINAKEITILNDNGNVAIRLGTSLSGQPEIELLNTVDNIPRICMSVEPETLSISFLAKDGSTLLGFGVDVHRGGGISIMSSNGKRLVTLEAGERIDEVITIAKAD